MCADYGAFAAPAKLAFTPTGSGTAPGGVIWATFTLPWPAGATALKVNIGAGGYTIGSPTGADGMMGHPVIPPASCVGSAGSMPAAC